MSVAVCGVIYMDKLDVYTQVNIAFGIMANAIENRIGFKMGGNVSEKVYDKFPSQPTSLLFEVMDDPLDMNAECLFNSEGCEIYVSDVRIDNDESLLSRLTRVQSFFNHILDIPYTKRVLLELNYHFIDENQEIVNVPISDFANLLLEMYEQNYNFVPPVRLELLK